ncbi:MAG TPA: protease inhibitor I42 family protein [Anaerolineae bacterium]|nr:protease inhibitor I42 family protein [Anaerolineae bacterium]
MQRFGDQTVAIRVSAYETFAVVLAGNPSTGYSWQVDVDFQHLELLEQTFEPAGEGIGAGGEEVFRFRARATGETRIACEYRRPWDKKARDTKHFRVVID